MQTNAIKLFQKAVEPKIRNYTSETVVNLASLLEVYHSITLNEKDKKSLSTVGGLIQTSYELQDCEKSSNKNESSGGPDIPEDKDLVKMAKPLDGWKIDEMKCGNFKQMSTRVSSSGIVNDYKKLKVKAKAEFSGLSNKVNVDADVYMITNFNIQFQLVPGGVYQSTRWKSDPKARSKAQGEWEIPWDPKDKSLQFITIRDHCTATSCGSDIVSGMGQFLVRIGSRFYVKAKGKWEGLVNEAEFDAELESVHFRSIIIPFGFSHGLAHSKAWWEGVTPI